MRVIYLHGIAGHASLSPVMARLIDTGAEVIAQRLPGFDGRSGFTAPVDHTEWLSRVWDTLDATGALPCPIVGASIGAMFAAELAIFRPEAVTRLVLMAPTGICDDAEPGVDLYALGGSRRLAALFAGETPRAFDTQFAELGDEQGVARYLAQVAGASLIWPLPDRGLASRVHRIRTPRLVLWGDRDQLMPSSLAGRWSDSPIMIPNAGHLLEWDAPDAAFHAIDEFLNQRSTP